MWYIVECPKEAKTCSGEKKVSGKAKATECKDGYRLQDDKCNSEYTSVVSAD